jgi:hypothetical protein
MILAAIALVILAPRMAASDHTVTDPREYCDHVAGLIVKQDIDELTADLLAHTNRIGTLADIRAGIGNLEPFWSKVGTLHSNAHVSAKKFGDDYVRHWYVFVYDLGPLFARCTMYRPGDSWLFINMEYSDKPEDTGLTK